MAKKNKKVNNTRANNTRVEAPESYVPIGKEYFERGSKATNEKVSVRDLSSSMNKNYMDTLFDTAVKAKSNYDTTFYIVVLTKVERIIKTAIRNYFVARQSCPTPNYGQTVYSFDPKNENLELLWLIPVKKICDKMYLDRFNIELIRDPLINYVVDYVEGRLLTKCMILNKEANDTVVLKKVIDN